ncbi:hypothetical protein DICA3_F03466 [Diutina catenulata]
MHASRVLLNAAKKSSAPKTSIPVEMFPLFAAVGVAIASGSFFTYRHFTHDKQLRLWKNADLSSLDDVLNEAVDNKKE